MGKPEVAAEKARVPAADKVRHELERLAPRVFAEATGRPECFLALHFANPKLFESAVF